MSVKNILQFYCFGICVLLFKMGLFAFREKFFDFNRPIG
jgi:hypothetical protein